MVKKFLMAAAAIGLLALGTPKAAVAEVCGPTSTSGDCWSKPQWICYVGPIMMDGFCEHGMPGCTLGAF